MIDYEPLIARCRVATKNTNAAVLLYRIAFWMPKAKVSHGKLKWVANSASQWCQQTGLSFDQYRRAIALLKTLGLVKTEQHLFGRKNVTHVRLTEKGWAITGKPPLDQGTAASPANGNSAHPEKCKNAQLYIQGDSYLETHQGESNKAFASAHANCLSLEKEQEVSGEDKSNNNPVSNKSSAFQIEEKSLRKPADEFHGCGATQLYPRRHPRFHGVPSPIQRHFNYAPSTDSAAEKIVITIRPAPIACTMTIRISSSYRSVRWQKKLSRLGREWIAMSRSDWARHPDAVEHGKGQKVRPQVCSN
jgi:hypothetical protein